MKSNEANIATIEFGPLKITFPVDSYERCEKVGDDEDRSPQQQGNNNTAFQTQDVSAQTKGMLAQTKGMLAQISAARPIAPPIGEHWDDLGGIYAGIARGVEGSDYHLVLLPGEKAEVNWAAAREWAKEHCGVLRGCSLPTRSEQALLYANLKSEFKPGAYWSSEEHESDSSSAWCQHFDYGGQGDGHKSAALRAVAVRRLPI